MQEYQERIPPGEKTDWLTRFFNGLRSAPIYRRTDHHMVGGVCSGLATRFNVDPALIRIVAVFSALFFGLGITLYLLAWFLLPDEQQRTHAERAVRDGHAGSVILLIIVLLDLTTFARGEFGFSVGWLGLALALAVWFAFVRRNGATESKPTAAQTTGSSTSGPGTTTGPSTATGSGVVMPSTRSTSSYPQDQRPGSPHPPTISEPGAPVPGTAAATTPARRTPGVFVVLLAAGLSLLTYLGVEAAAHAYDLPGSAQLLALAGVVAVLAVILLVLGFTGRRGGLIATAATILTILLVGVAAADRFNVDVASGIGDAHWRPTAVSAIQQDYRLSMGDATLDLSALPRDQLAGAATSANLSMGDLTVIVPQDVPVAVNASVRFGDLTWYDDNDQKHTHSNGSRELTFAGTAASAAATPGTAIPSGGTTPSGSTTTTAPPQAATQPVLTVQATVALGDLRIEQR